MTDEDYGIGPNRAVQERMERISKAPWSFEEWQDWITKAWRNRNRLEAAALARAQANKVLGQTESIDARVLEILSTPGTPSTTHDTWRERRMEAFRHNAVVELAALTFIQYLFDY